jgi:hypothetical protein
MALQQKLTREQDEVHLTWMRLHSAGWTSGQIGKKYATRPEYVRTVLNRIKADTAKSEAR